MPRDGVWLVCSGILTGRHVALHSENQSDSGSSSGIQSILASDMECSHFSLFFLNNFIKRLAMDHTKRFTMTKQTPNTPPSSRRFATPTLFTRFSAGLNTLSWRITDTTNSNRFLAKRLNHRMMSRGRGRYWIGQRSPPSFGLSLNSASLFRRPWRTIEI